MGDLREEYRRIERRLRETRRMIAQRMPPQRGGRPSLRGKVIDNGSIPTTPMKYFLVNPARILGPVEEGTDPGSTFNAAQKIPVLVMGPQVPRAGDLISAWNVVGGRWVSQGDGCDLVVNV